jgi:hypothetical protein
MILGIIGHVFYFSLPTREIASAHEKLSVHIIPKPLRLSSKDSGIQKRDNYSSQLDFSFINMRLCLIHTCNKHLITHVPHAIRILFVILSLSNL